MSSKSSTKKSRSRRMPTKAVPSTLTPSPLEPVRETVKKHFPKLWPAVEAGLSACATLFLADHANPTALVFVGRSSAGKTTVASMFDDGEMKEKPWVYRSDQFSAAAFVSHCANRSEEELQEIDLLPRIKDRILLTLDLSAIFRGREEELAKRFSTLTRVLDGQGFSSDSGVYGQRGYRGDYIFGWIGCTTPLPPSAWRTMAELGNRLIFFAMEPSEGIESVHELAAMITSELSYRKKMDQCRQAVCASLDGLFGTYGAVRQMHWPRRGTSTELATKIGHLAKLLALLRNPLLQKSDSRPKAESPTRAVVSLHNLARGHALIAGREKLIEEDLLVVAWVTLSSMPASRRAVLVALARKSGEPASVQDVADAGSVSRHTAESYMHEAGEIGLCEFRREGNGKTSSLHVKPEWEVYVTGPIGRLIGQAATWQSSGDARTETDDDLDSLNGDTDDSMF